MWSTIMGYSLVGCVQCYTHGEEDSQVSIGHINRASGTVAIYKKAGVQTTFLDVLSGSSDGCTGFYAQTRERTRCYTSSRFIERDYDEV